MDPWSQNPCSSVFISSVSLQNLHILPVPIVFSSINQRKGYLSTLGIVCDNANNNAFVSQCVQHTEELKKLQLLFFISCVINFHLNLMIFFMHEAVPCSPSTFPFPLYESPSVNTCLLLFVCIVSIDILPYSCSRVFCVLSTGWL